ncbi:MAG TPA: hypothetical protein VFO41_16850 [Alphaproteobacteria bacterium]|nr:hypothetical protein [Alphaproteobacteria bacterium]
MSLYPMDEDRDTPDLRIALREFCTLGLFAACLFGMLVLAHGAIS